MTDFILNYVCEPLLNAYKSKDYIQGIRACRDRLIDSYPKLNTSVCTGGVGYAIRLLEFEQKMQLRDYHGACGKLIDAFSEYYAMGCSQNAEFNLFETKLGTVCAANFLHSMNRALEGQ